MEEEKKSFVVKDKRIFDESGAVRPEAKPESAREETAPEGEEADLKKEGRIEEEGAVEVNFYNFILSLSTSAFFHLGDFPDPATNKTDKNLSAAKQIIDTLSMLKIKTEGNLDQTEKNFLEGLLFELRMRYVKETA